MVPSRHSARIRIPALILLLWVAFDVGAHGLLASDFDPVTGPSASSREASVGSSLARTSAIPDHCFCHGISTGIVVAPLPVALTPADTVILAGCPEPAAKDGPPLDHPPHPAA